MYQALPKTYRTKKSNTGRKSLITQNLNYWAKIIKIDGVCALCGSSYKLEAHHIVKRGVYIHNGWFLTTNGIPLCWNCHYKKIHALYFPTVQDTQKQINRWLIDHRGTTYDQLYVQCKQIKIYSDVETLKMIRIGLREQLKKMKKERS